VAIEARHEREAIRGIEVVVNDEDAARFRLECRRIARGSVKIRADLVGSFGRGAS
jgi:hypothetical protein